MKANINTLSMFVSILIFISCSSRKPEEIRRKVEVREENGRYILYKNRKPYYIQGASGSKYLGEVKKFGGNSIRTYGGENIQVVLDSAHKYGLSVTVGLYLAPLKYGFDYNNESAVKNQLMQVKKQVLRYKNHPALLMWAVGNEVNMQADGKPDDQTVLWKAINDIAKMIHETDPDHPVTTMVPPYGSTILKVKMHCPELDILSFNTFGAIQDLEPKVNRPLVGWSKPYIVSEWGGPGWWESEKTVWDVPIENTSTYKAKIYKESYDKALAIQAPKCLGAYVFYWGQKQEKTQTWFSMFDHRGNMTEAVHVIRYYWNKEKNLNRPPVMQTLTMNNKKPENNVFVDFGTLNEANIIVEDPENDSLHIEWEIKPESLMEGFWGENEKEPRSIFRTSGRDLKTLRFKAPEEEGPYRLFCNVYDGKRNISTANFPFYVVRE